jgi:cell migration-inducing and hyaluronan-binding protein
MEDGVEHGNRFVHNLGVQTKCHPTLPCVPTRLAAAGEDPTYGDRQAVRANGQASEDVLLPSDNTASTFWITNPDNIYVDNVAAGSDSTGFWMSLPEHPNGAFEGSEISQNTWPRRTKFREFKGNVAHSNYDGFMFDRNINADNTFGVTGNAHMPKEDPADPDSTTLESVFEDLTAYKNRNGGIWGRGEMHIFRNVKVADNAMGYTHASGSFGSDPFTSLVVDSLFVGETDNVGNPETDGEIAYGRSLPKPSMPDFPIRGYEYYDYRHDVENTTFVNYEDNATRKTGALSYLMYTSAGVSTENAIEGAKFVNAKPVYFPQMVYEWGNDHLGSVAWKTAVFHDKDGSVGGVPDSYILINDGENDSIAADEQACQIRPAWNAAVCTGDVGRLNIGSAGGAGGGRGGFGGGAAAEPVILSRNGRDFPVTRNQSNVRAGTEIKVITERPDVSLSLREMDKGSWVIFELPGFTTPASGTQLSSLDALRKASDTAYFKDKDALWVKVVSNGESARGVSGRGPGGETSIEVSR